MQRPSILPRTDAGGEIFRAVEAVKMRIQQSDEEVTSIRLVNEDVEAVKMLDLSGLWEHTYIVC